MLPAYPAYVLILIGLSKLKSSPITTLLGCLKASHSVSQSANKGSFLNSSSVCSLCSCDKSVTPFFKSTEYLILADRHLLSASFLFFSMAFNPVDFHKGFRLPFTSLRLIVISVRRSRGLPPPSFRFLLAMVTLGLGYHLRCRPCRVLDFNRLD